MWDDGFLEEDAVAGSAAEFGDGFEGVAVAGEGDEG